MPIDQITSASLASGVPTRAQLPAGSVLQVVNVIITTQTIFSSATYADATDFNASITPTSTNSRILVCMNISVLLDNYAAGATGIGGRIVRGSTDIFEQQLAYNYGAAVNQIVPVMYLDSPASTSSLTYKLQVRASSTYNSSRINGSGQPYTNKSTITLLEIAG